MKQRFFIQGCGDHINFDMTTESRYDSYYYDNPDKLVMHDNNTYYKEDDGNGQWFGGQGYLADPIKFFKDKEAFEVTKEEYNDIWNACCHSTTQKKEELT